MSRLRLCLASLVLATTMSSAACTGITRPAPRSVPQHTQLDRAAVRAKLAARRKVVFARFLAYREGRVYPINNLPVDGPRHLWFDDWGNLCAAATLISADWGRDATMRIGATDRQIQIASIHTGAVNDWILTSGLTQQELVAIQLPGDPITMPIQPEQREQEIARMFRTYVDVERQIRSMWESNLDAATDALMRHPDLARSVLRGQVAGAGEFATPPIG